MSTAPNDRDCPYHVRLHPDEKCTCPPKRSVADAEQEWPLHDVLTRLADFADDRLARKDYDGHDHESLRVCVDRAREILSDSAEEKSATLKCYICGNADLHGLMKLNAAGTDWRCLLRNECKQRAFEAASSKRLAARLP